MAPDGPNRHASWMAIGTTVVLRVLDAGALPDARAAVERELAVIDRACSRFRPDSDLSRLNARAGRATTVGPVLMQALIQALRAAELTEGDVDPAIGGALEIAGYDRDFALLESPLEHPAPAPALTVRMRSGWREISLDIARSAVRTPAGMRLDLGATAKAWAADRAAAAAAAAAGCGVLVSIGGDIAVRGSHPPGGWQIHVTDDHRSGPTAPGQTVAIESGGLATSSTSVRRWSHGTSNMHHIIDPRSGAPVRGSWRTVSVAAGDCTDANIAATAAIVRGESAPQWLEQIGMPARLVDEAGAATIVAGWPAESAAEGVPGWSNAA